MKNSIIDARMLRKTILIPADLHMEILKYLPSKSLMRFRFVSKTWNLIVGDPKFAKLHRTISETRPGATTTIFCGSCGGYYGTSFLYFCKITQQREAIHELTINTSQFERSECYVTQVVNGLVCLYKRGDIQVCNITTHEIISLPTHPLTRGFFSNLLYCLGYDPLNNEYKILCILIGLGPCNKFSVFTIRKDKEWREVINPLEINLKPTFNHDLMDVLYHDGAINWLSSTDHEFKRNLVAFDVREEKFRAISVPTFHTQNLVRIGGHIVIYECVGGSNLFMLEDDQNCVRVDSNIQVPVFFHPYGSVENKLIFHSHYRKELAFDPNNGEVSLFELSGLDNAIKESTREFLRKFFISEIVENIYPLRQN